MLLRNIAPRNKVHAIPPNEGNFSSPTRPNSSTPDLAKPPTLDTSPAWKKTIESGFSPQTRKKTGVAGPEKERKNGDISWSFFSLRICKVTLAWPFVFKLSGATAKWYVIWTDM